MQPSERRDAVRALLADPARRPAIVYAPTRKEAEALARAAPGALPRRRLPRGHDHRRPRPRADRLPRRPARGHRRHHRLRHGRRQGGRPHRDPHRRSPAASRATTRRSAAPAATASPSRAILLHSFADRRNHEFFHEPRLPGARRCSSASTARSRAGAAGGRPDPQAPEDGRGAVREGAREALDPRRRPGRPGRQRRRGRRRLAAALPRPARPQARAARADGRYAEAHGCRMLHLVRHFGDQEDSGEPCGLCDVCAPADCGVRRMRPLNALEQGLVDRTLTALRGRDGQSTGQLYREVCPRGALRPQVVRAPPRRA